MHSKYHMQSVMHILYATHLVYGVSTYHDPAHTQEDDDTEYVDET